MSVITNGCTVYAHKSMPMNEIVVISQRSEYLISTVDVLSPADIVDTELFLALFGYGKTLVRTCGRGAKKIYDRTHTPAHCACVCKIHRGFIHNHTRQRSTHD